MEDKKRVVAWEIRLLWNDAHESRLTEIPDDIAEGIDQVITQYEEDYNE